MAVDTVIDYPELTQAVRAQFGTIPPAVTALLFEFSQAVLDFIRANWPIDTGRSLAAWRVGPADGVVGLRLLNEAADEHGEYAEYVHFAGTPADPTQADILTEQIRDVLRAPLTDSIRALMPSVQRLPTGFSVGAP